MLKPSHVACSLLLVVGLTLTLVEVMAAEIRKVDPNGRVRYDQPSLVERNGKMYVKEPNGNVRYDKPSLKVEGWRVYQVDPNGRVRYDKPSGVISK